MMAYLRFMKCADTDQQLLDLNTEVNDLRTKIHNLNQLTASQMLENVEFTESTYESFGFPDIKIVKSDSKRHFTQKTSVAEIKKEIKPRKSGYKGVYFAHSMGKWTIKVQYKGKIYANSSHDTEEQAVTARDTAILKFYLPFDLQILKKPENNEK